MWLWYRLSRGSSALTPSGVSLSARSEPSGIPFSTGFGADGRVIVMPELVPCGPTSESVTC